MPGRATSIPALLEAGREGDAGNIKIIDDIVN